MLLNIKSPSQRAVFQQSDTSTKRAVFCIYVCNSAKIFMFSLFIFKISFIILAFFLQYCNNFCRKRIFYTFKVLLTHSHMDFIFQFFLIFALTDFLHYAKIKYTKFLLHFWQTFVCIITRFFIIPELFSCFCPLLFCAILQERNLYEGYENPMASRFCGRHEPGAAGGQGEPDFSQGTQSEHEASVH